MQFLTFKSALQLIRAYKINFQYSYNYALDLDRITIHEVGCCLHGTDKETVFETVQLKDIA
jgi:hypothetical protein